MRKTYLAIFFSLITLLAMSGCGGSSTKTPPVVAFFNNASFAGSYAFTANGVNGSGIFTLMGILQADGNGAITSGRTFYNSTATGFAGNFSVGGSYLVAPDGRTNVNLNADFIGPLNLDLVLLSAQHGLVVRFDNTATASGSLDKQDPTAFTAAAMAGTYVYNLIGTNSAGMPEASVGTFTVDSASNITGGVQDTNNNGVVTANAPILAGPTSVFDIVAGIGNGVFSYT